jgi:hypothetical protein
MHRKRFKKWMILPFGALTTFGFTEIASNKATWVESIYSQKIYPPIASIISFVSNLFPFSLDDLLYFSLITLLLALIALVISKKVSYQTTLKIILNTLSIVYISFYFLWGFNYFREDLNTRLSLSEQNPDTEEFIKQLEGLILNTNNSYHPFEELDKNEINIQIEESYKKLASALKLNYPAGKRKDKTITLSRFFAMAGISGYYGPFFNEVHVNSKVLPLEYPFVLAHEKAHQFGITSEAEANFYAWLVCTKSDSKALQYSANLHILRFFIYQGYQLEKYSETVEKLDERIKADFIKIRENWLLLRNDKVDKVASKVNDAYLKTNKIEKGIEDYRGVVKFVMDFSQDSVFQQKIKASSF